ncbi:dihydrolipoyl dehydrogenase family protein [Spirochaeta dissipatitropha]
MKTSYTHDIIIIGGGAAGLSTASGCAQLGMKTALVEREHTGGDCLYFGCVPSKTLIRSASVMQSARDAEHFGLQVAVQISQDVLNMTALNQRIADVIGTIAPHDSPERFRDLGVDVFECTARFLDSHRLALSEGSEISAKKIVLATGSRPAVPPIKGLEETGFLTNKDIFSMKKLPESIITIGGGPIGVELSQALARLGSKVFLVELAAHILPREDADMAAIVAGRIQREGVELICGTGVTSVSRQGKSVELVLADGRSLHAEQILLATGRSGNVEDLDIEKADVTIERGYFRVDSRLRTSKKHIYAIGDCNGRMQFTHTAAAEASLMVKQLALHLPGKMNWDAIPWCTYTEPELASVGLNESAAAAAGIRYSTAEAALSNNDRALAENESEGKLKLLYDPGKKLIGAQIAGPHAGELLLPAIIALSKGWKISAFLSFMYPYPTVSEAYKRAVGEVYSSKLFNPRVRRLLRILFGYRGKK